MKKVSLYVKMTINFVKNLFKSKKEESPKSEWQNMYRFLQNLDSL